jgi:chorismate dehydratase
MVCHREEKIRSVALDTNSRTSVALIKLLLQKRIGLDLTFVHHEPNLDAMLRKCDAALLIGDAALKLSHQEYEVVDLAEAWIKWQKRPFVFALWACRGEESAPQDLVAVFHEAKAFGLRSRPEIAKQYAQKLNLPEAFLMEYLFRNIDYDLTISHMEGLEKFYSLAYAAGLIPGHDRVRFLRECADVGTASG